MNIGYLLQSGAPAIQEQPRSGPSNHVAQVVAGLRRFGHQVRILAQGHDGISISQDLARFECVAEGFWYHSFPRLCERGIRRIQSELQLPYVGLFDSLRFAAACKRELADCDLFYERMGWMGYAGALASRRSGKPLVLEVNGDHLEELEALGRAPKGYQLKLSVALTRWAAHQADHVVATGDGWKQRFVERWQVAPEKVSVIENGSELVNALERTDLRSFCELNPTDDEVTAVYIGAFEPWHGLQILIRALHQVLTTTDFRVRLVLIGGGREEEVLKTQIHDLGLAAQVTLTGFIPPAEIASHLKRADIGLSPYCGRSEFSGLKLLDYKAAGLAIIASGKDGQPAVIKHGRTGWIVPPCDPESLAQALVRMVSDAGLRRNLGRSARLEAEQRHSWTHTASQIDALLQELTTARSTTVDDRPVSVIGAPGQR